MFRFSVLPDKSCELSLPGKIRKIHCLSTSYAAIATEFDRFKLLSSGLIGILTQESGLSCKSSSGNPLSSAEDDKAVVLIAYVAVDVPALCCKVVILSAFGSLKKVVQSIVIGYIQLIPIVKPGAL